MNKMLLNGIASVMMPLGLVNASQTMGSYYGSYLRRSNAALGFTKHDANRQLLPSINVSTQVSDSKEKRFGTSELVQTTEAHDDLKLSLGKESAVVSQLGRVSDLTLSHSGNIKELIVIDAAVPDKHLFYQKLKPGVEVVEISPNVDGLAQLVMHLQGYENLDALHIVSHGSDGVIFLGNSEINADLLRERVSAISALDGSMKDGGDLLLYGCNLAKTEKGEALLELLSNQANVDVAASNDLTGNSVLNGDWELEIAKGNIETDSPFSDIAIKEYRAVLFDKTIDMSGFPTGYLEPNTYGYSGATVRLSIDDGDPDGNSLYCYDTGGGDYCYVDYADLSTGDKKLYFDFSTGEEFDVSTISLLSFVSQDLKISSDKGDTTNITVTGASTPTLNWTNITKLTIEKQDASDISRLRLDNFVLTNVEQPVVDDTDGALTASATVTEPVALPTTVDTVGEATNVFDFTLSDGGSGDAQPMAVSQVVLNVTGTTSDATRAKVTWRLNGPDASNVAGTYNAGADTITFSGLSISVADGGSEVYTVNAYYNDNTGLSEDETFILSVDGDTDLTVGAGTQMGATTAVTNATGSTIDVTATALAFTTQPATSTSGAALGTQPVVTAQDAFGNTDTDFTETITLTEASLGSLSGDVDIAAVSGVATFTDVAYTATADQQSFTLTANDEDGVGSNLATVDANAVTSDVVATKLIFTAQPSPLSGLDGLGLDFSTDPVVQAVDANDVLDTGYSTAITLSEVNGAGSVAMTGDTDTDGSGATVTLNPSSGQSTFTNLVVTYTNSGGSAETYNLRASSGGLTTADSSQLTSSVLEITSTTYDANLGTLVVTGTDFVANGSGFDVDATRFTFTGEAGATYQLTDTSNVEITSATEFTLSLSATDKAAVNQILNKDGTTSTSATSYNLAAADNWLTDASLTNNIADATNGITVSSVAAPTITSADYDYSTNVLTATATGLLKRSGATNDIDVSTLTITGEGGATYTLASSSDVEITSGTSFSITLSGADIFNVEALLNADGGGSATSGTTYNLAAAEDWNTGADTAVNIADATNGITVANYAAPSITSSTYDWSTGQLVLTAENLVNNAAGNDIDASQFSVTGEGGTYQLTDSSDFEIASDTTATVLLSSADMLSVHGVLNKNGGTSSGGTTYNLEALDGWVTGSPAAVDIADTVNAITVSNVCVPTITSVGYDSDTGVVSVTGTCFFKKVGADNDIDLTKFIFTGGIADDTYQLTTTTNPEISSDTSFSFTLTGADRTEVDALWDQFGTTSSGGSTYNVEVLNGWIASNDGATSNIADATVTSTVVVLPKITSATYDPNTGNLVVTGTDFQPNGGGDDVDVTKLIFTGEAGATHQLTGTTTANVEITNATEFTVVVSGADKTAFDALVTSSGTTAADSTAYNLAALDDWQTVVTDGDSSDNTATVDVSNTAPVVSGLNGDGSIYTVGDTAIVIDGSSNATLSDITTPALDGGTIVVSISANNEPGEDVLKIGDLGDISNSGTNVVHAAGGGTTIATFTGGDSGNDLSISLNSEATPARVQDLLRALQYWNSDSTTVNLAARTITVDIDDGELSNSAAVTQTVTITLVKAPIIDLDADNSSGSTGNDYSTTFLTSVGTAVAVADTDNTITDDGTFKSLTVTLTNHPDGADESLASTFGTGASVDVGGEAITISYTSGTGVLSAIVDDSSASAATMQSLIASIQYDNASGTPTMDDRIITFSAIDNADNAGPDSTATVSLVDQNTAPALTGLNGTPSFTEHGSAVVLDADVTVSDTQLDVGDDYGSATLTLARNGSASSQDVFEATGTLSTLTQGAAFNLGAGDIGTVSTNSNGTLSLTFAAGASAANVASVMQQIAYSNSSHRPPSSAQINWTFSDGNAGAQGTGGALTATGSTTVSITNVNDATTGQLNISGLASEGATLSANTSALGDLDGLGSFSYQWQSGGVNVGSDTSTYVVSASDIGNTITLTVSYTDGSGFAGGATSDPTAVVVNVNDSPTGEVLVAGVVEEDQTLTADVSTITDADGLGEFAYQWLRSGVAIDGATSSTYLLGDNDVGQTMSVSISYVDGFGATEGLTSTATSPVANINDLPTGAVLISGVVEEDQTLTADASAVTDADGLGEFSHQWFRSGVAVEGATSTSYLLGDIDVGQSISVSISYTDGFGTSESLSSSPSAVVANINDAPVGDVVISGNPMNGQTLTASNTLADADGLGAISYQWNRNAELIVGATGDSYVLVSDDVGSAISVVASYTDMNGTLESKASSSVSVAGSNSLPTGTVTISGSVVEDQSLTADTASLSDDDGLGEFSYQWSRDSVAIDGATASTYLLGDDDVGALISVSVSYVDGIGTSESVTSASTAAVQNINDEPSGAVTISGDATEGETLTASNTLSDIEGLGEIAYQWLRNGQAIVGASSSSYILTSADVGTSISVMASYTDGLGTQESMTSSAVTPVAANQEPGEPTEPNTPPTITAPDAVTVNATGLFTEVDLGLAIANDAEDGVLAVTVDSNGFFAPGTHTVTWSALDSAGAEVTDTQVVNVIPLVALDKNSRSTEGGKAGFTVILNGVAVNYPVTVPYTVSGSASTDGSDHDLTDGVVTIEEGQLEASVEFNIVDDGAGEGQENILITLGRPTNAVNGIGSIKRIEISEGNVAPTVKLGSDQGGVFNPVVAQDKGLVIVLADVQDPNPGDEHTYDWSLSDNALVDQDDDEKTFTFDPSGMSAGIYKLRVTATDGDNASGVDQLRIRIEEALPELSPETDSDKDGVSDRDEGLGDDDDDGIPDFLDSANLARNVVQERQADDTSFLMETEPGLVLTLGEVAFRANGGKTEVSEDDIVNHGNEGTGAQQDEEQYEYNNGLFDFNVEELPVAGQSVSIVVAQFAPVPRDAVYRKLMPTGWADFVINDNNSVASAQGSEGFCPPPGDVAYVTGLTEGHWCVQLTIEDGGPNDADGEVNQAIDDPGGVASLAVNQVAVSVSGGSVSPYAFVLLMLAGMRRAFIRRLVLCIALFALSGHSHAWYAGGSLGVANGGTSLADMNHALQQSDTDAVASNLDDSRNAWSFFVGKQIDSHFSLETGYTNLGESKVDINGSTSDSSASFVSAVKAAHPSSAHGLDMAFKGAWQADEKVSVAGKAGFMLWKSEYDFKAGDVKQTVKDNGLGLLLGIEGRYQLDPDYRLRLQLDWREVDDENMNSVSLGLEYHWD